jgi:predicted regulator of Ras-like GTPase activity (Roadblock/LC7/MglB family)
MKPSGAPSWSFGPSDSERIEEILNNLLYESNARCALLVDRTGQLVTTVGEQPDFDSAAFASLTAADFSANDQLAALIGEEDFNSLFHQGRSESMYLADVGKRLILVVLFNQQTTLGLVRIKIKDAVTGLNRAFEEVFGRAEGVESPALERGFVDEAEDEIDRLFRE